MDMETLSAAIAVAKSIPGSAAATATDAADRAEAAAAVAETHNYGISVSNTTLMITPPSN